MALNYVELTIDVYDGSGSYPVSGTVTFTPSAVLTDTTDHEIVAQIPVVASFRAGSLPVVKLLATDNGALAPSGWGWSVTFTGKDMPPGFDFFLPYTGGGSQYLSSQNPVSSVVTMAAYLPIDYPTGAADGYVWTSDSSGTGSWEAPGEDLGVAASLVGLAPSGDATGATDTTNIQALLNLAADAKLQDGTFYTSAPLLAPAGAMFRGGKGATPSIYDGNPPSAGTIIKPVAAWSAGAVSPAAVVVINGAGVQLRDFWIDGTLLWSTLSAGQIGNSSTPNVTADGINDGAGQKACGLRNVGVYGVTAHGIKQSGSGWHLLECLTDLTYNDGFWGAWQDSVLVNCHAQTAGLDGAGAGFFVNGGQQAKFIGCRGDLSQNGFSVSLKNSASSGQACQFTGCGTQRNNRNGYLLASSSATGGRLPVLLSGCSSVGDGVNGTVVPTGGSPGGTISGGAGGGGYAAVAVQGSAEVTIAGFQNAASTGDVAGGCPQYAIATAAVSAQVPAIVQVEGAFLNAITGLINDAAPSASFLAGLAVTGYVGAPFPGGATPVARVTPTVPTLNQNTSGTAAGLSSTLAIGSGGTGQATQQAALDALAGAVTSNQVLAGNGTHVTLRALAAADLPAGTTGAQGALQLDGTAANILPVGVQAAGANGKAADSGHVHPNEAYLSMYLAPTGALAETFSRRSCTTNSIAPGNGTLTLIAIPLLAGQVITNIVFYTGGTAKAGGTHGWYVITDSSLKVRAATADQTDGSTTWGTQNTIQSLPIAKVAGASATTYTVPSSGLYYLGVMVAETSGTMPTFTGAPTVTTNIAANAPQIQGPTTGGGSTTPPATDGSVTLVFSGAVVSSGFYAYVS